MKKYNTILIEKVQNRDYYQVKLINMNILREKVKGCEYRSDQSRVIEQAKFTYSLSRKAFQR